QPPPCQPPPPPCQPPPPPCQPPPPPPWPCQSARAEPVPQTASRIARTTPVGNRRDNIAPSVSFIIFGRQSGRSYGATCSRITKGNTHESCSHRSRRDGN